MTLLSLGSGFSINVEGTILVSSPSVCPPKIKENIVYRVYLVEDFEKLL